MCGLPSGHTGPKTYSNGSNLSHHHTLLSPSPSLIHLNGRATRNAYITSNQPPRKSVTLSTSLDHDIYYIRQPWPDRIELNIFAQRTEFMFRYFVWPAGVNRQTPIRLIFSIYLSLAPTSERWVKSVLMDSWTGQRVQRDVNANYGHPSEIWGWLCWILSASLNLIHY